MKSFLAFIRKHPILPLLVLTNLTFLLLYRHFVFHNAVFMYSDGGSDSLSSSYPIITMLSRLFSEGTFSHFTLWDGLGIDTTSIFLQYLNPVKALLLFFGRDGFPAGIMVFVFVVTNLTAFFGYGFFRRLLSDGRPAVFAALAWTFSSYVTIWGQNYSFSMNILLFTLCMFVLEIWLSRHSFPAFVGLVAALALFLFSNYYFLYMTGIFMAGYTLLRSLFPDRKIVSNKYKSDALSANSKSNGKAGSTILLIIKEECLLALSALLTLVVAMPAVVAIYYSLFGSARTKGGVGLLSLFRLYEPEYFLTFLGRLFSPDLFGTDRLFTGPINYFEIAFLSTSLLFLFAMLYLLAKKSTRRLTAVLGVLSILLLATPVTSFVLTQAVVSQRYSFLLIFGECVAIGFFAKDLLLSVDRKALRLSVIAVPAFAAASLGLLFLAGPAFGMEIKAGPVGIALLFLVLFELVFLAVLFRGSWQRFLMPVLSAVLVAELVVTLSPSLYDREYLTRETFATQFFNDGTQKVVESLKATDPDLYRIETTTDYNFANEGQVDQFNSVHGYYNTNPESMLTLANTFGATQLSTSFFLLGHQHYYLYTLLAGRYKVVDRDLTITLNAMDEDLYEPLADADNCILFKNRNALPFGYVYDKAFDGKTLYWTDAKDRLRLLANGYYMTSWEKPPTPVSDTEEALGELSQGESVPILSEIFHANDCEWELDERGALHIHLTGPDPYLLFRADDIEEGGSHFLSVSAEFDEEVSKSCDLEYFVMTKRNSAPPDCQNSTFTLNTSTTSAAFLIPDDIIAVRVDINSAKDVILSELAVETLPTASDDFAALKKTQISDISLEKDTYRCKVVGNTDHSMLCVPILYTGRWSATVNGEPVQVRNINGGLCGVLLNKGENEVVMHYTLPFFNLAVWISLGSVLLLLAALVLWAVRRHRTAS